jgi:hypothetical protein
LSHTLVWGWAEIIIDNSQCPRVLSDDIAETVASMTEDDPGVESEKASYKALG